eukprot:scaffold37999_cov214-Skeletonema_marinoi.AAC.9
MPRYLLAYLRHGTTTSSTMIVSQLHHVQADTLLKNAKQTRRSCASFLYVTLWNFFVIASGSMPQLEKVVLHSTVNDLHLPTNSISILHSHKLEFLLRLSNFKQFLGEMIALASHACCAVYLYTSPMHNLSLS